MSRYSTSLVSNNRDKMSRFLAGITRDLEEECWAVMLHDNRDRSKLMVHVQQVEYNWKKRGVRDARKPKPSNQASPRNSCNRKNIGACEQPKFKNGHKSLRNSNIQRTATRRDGRLEPEKGNGGDVQHP